MVEFTAITLENGLRILAHQDRYTPMAAVNILYHVGSKDEEADKTGFAHLFEHLMFGGSSNARNFDQIMQNAGGENNAFTNSDLTNFYNILPIANLETALFLEADRMENLLINQETLSTQKKVVVEEFHETCFNEPYGDAWHNLLDLSFEEHHYRWPTIGKIPEHIEEANLDQVQEFYNKFYHPSNAILSVCANLPVNEIIDLCRKYFGHIQPGSSTHRVSNIEPPQRDAKRRLLEQDVPNDSVMLAFHMGNRTSRTYYIADLITDLLANGHSSRLQSVLLDEEDIFFNIDAYVTGSLDPGLLIIEGQPSEGVSLEAAEKRIWQELEKIKKEGFISSELIKQKNKIRTNLVMSETSALTKAMSLGYYQLLGDPDLINGEDDIYQMISMDDIIEESRVLFRPENSSTLLYKAVM